MNSIEYISKILYYFVFVVLLYNFAIKGLRQQRSEDRCSSEAVILAYGPKRRKRSRLALGGIMILCLVCGIYAIICGQVPYSSDRGNYARRFVNEINISRASLGLYWLETLLRLFTHNPNALFFTIACFCLSITLVAYRAFPDAAPETLLFMGLSPYCTYSFYLLKQAPAIALVALSVAAFMRRKWLICIATVMLAMLFHESAYIMIPLLVAMLGSKSKLVRMLEYMGVFVCVVFFERINAGMVSLVQRIIPGMAYQLEVFVDSSGGIEISNNFITILKGLPYYIITFYAIKNRPLLKERIAYYDRYLLMSVFTSAASIMSGYMYWMWRFGAYGYLPTFVFASLLCRETENTQTKALFRAALCLSLGVFTLRTLIQYYFRYGGF